jgi:GntR family transcriptional regulator / MocR family aminotransferase
VPPRLLDAVTDEKDLADCGTARIDQHAFATVLSRGDLDHHLRCMRTRYHRRRDLLVEALADDLPEAEVRGIAAGLHATVELPGDYEERAILDEARRRRIDLTTMRDFRMNPGRVPLRCCSGMARSPRHPSPRGFASSPERFERQRPGAAGAARGSSDPAEPAPANRPSVASSG